MTSPNDRRRIDVYSSSQYPLDLQWVLFELPQQGMALGARLVFEGVRPGRVTHVGWGDLDRRGRVLTVGSTAIHLSRSCRAALGPRQHGSGPLVTGWDGTAVSQRRLRKAVTKACLAVGVGPWTLRDLYVKGVEHRAARQTWIYRAAASYGATGVPWSVRAPYSTLGMGLLRPAHSGAELALRVRAVRPGLSEPVEEWLQRARHTETPAPPPSLESRAASYAVAAGLSANSTDTILTEALIRLAAMWTIDDLLGEDRAEVFAVLVRDGTALDRASELARLLTDPWPVPGAASPAGRLPGVDSHGRAVGVRNSQADPVSLTREGPSRRAWRGRLPQHRPFPGVRHFRSAF